MRFTFHANFIPARDENALTALVAANFKFLGDAPRFHMSSAFGASFTQTSDIALSVEQRNVAR